MQTSTENIKKKCWDQTVLKMWSQIFEKNPNCALNVL